MLTLRVGALLAMMDGNVCEQFSECLVLHCIGVFVVLDLNMLDTPILSSTRDMGPKFGKLLWDFWASGFGYQ